MPEFDNFPDKNNLQATKRLSNKQFSSELSKRFLGNPEGAGVAFVSHVDRAWQTSFTWFGAGSQVKDFQEMIQRLMAGRRLGYAFEVMTRRYGGLSTLFAVELLRRLQSGENSSPDATKILINYWISALDARNFVICGDPAVKLNTN